MEFLRILPLSVILVGILLMLFSHIYSNYLFGLHFFGNEEKDDGVASKVENSDEFSSKPNVNDQLDEDVWQNILLLKVDMRQIEEFLVQTVTSYMTKSKEVKDFLHAILAEKFYLPSAICPTYFGTELLDELNIVGRVMNMSDICKRYKEGTMFLEETAPAEFLANGSDDVRRDCHVAMNKEAVRDSVVSIVMIKLSCMIPPKTRSVPEPNDAGMFP